jgi:deazaflavin-dependent oxidoreductase (nitroreductase family)
MGWLLGHRFMVLRHTGRKSGARHNTVLEVVRCDSASRTCIVASSWGAEAQWFRNIVVNPEVEITIGTETSPARARWMRPEEAEQELRDYAGRHPWAMKGVARFMLGRPYRGLDKDCALLLVQVPLVELRPRGGPGTGPL